METKRLRLRAWQPSDLAPYAEMNADPEVMRYLPSTLDRQQSDQQAQKRQQLITQQGWGFWAVELKANKEFIGYVGLHQQSENAAIPNSPFVEIGWRLASQHWNKGYATEAAVQALDFGFHHLNLDAVYAFTTLTNTASRRVMQKIGMIDTNSNFLHPKLPDNHPLKPHCLYKITQRQFTLSIAR